MFNIKKETFSCSNIGTLKPTTLAAMSKKRIYMLNDNGRMLATELILRTRPIIFRSISSKLLPCVSGTHNISNTNPMTQIAPKNQKQPLRPIASEKFKLLLPVVRCQQRFMTTGGVASPSQRHLSTFLWSSVVVFVCSTY